MIEACGRECRTVAVLRWAAFPATLTGAVLGGHALLSVGAPDVVALLVPIGLLVLSIVLLERLVPWEPAWSRARGDVPTDLAHVTATVLLAPVIQGVTIAALPVVAGGWISETPLVAEVALVVVLGDLAPYLVHRASHERSPLLFRIHAVHHAPTRLYWLNAFRVHPINLATNTALQLAPGLLLGASHKALFLAGVVSATVNVWAHANVDVRLGVLDWIFSGPTLHRMHHHVDVPTSQGNYGGTTVLWDIAFGTRHAPASVRDGEVGIGDATPPEGWMAQLFHPFGVRCCAGAA